MMLRHTATRSFVPAARRALLISAGAPAETTTVARCFSSEEKSPGVFGRMQNAFTERQERNQQQEFANQLTKMSNSDIWTIQEFAADLSKMTDSWRAKVPGLSNLPQLKTAKQANSIAQAIMKQVGPDSTSETLMAMTRTDKLKISIESGASVEEINTMLQQFQGVDVMHQVVRRRKLDGKPIPTDEAAMRSVMQTNGLKSLSKSQRKTMQAARMKQGMRGIGKSGKR